MNLKRTRRRARFVFALCLLVFIVGLIAFQGGGFNQTTARFLCGVVLVSGAFRCIFFELLFNRKMRRAAARAEKNAAEEGRIVIGMPPPRKRLRSRAWQERGTLMPGGVGSQNQVSDADLDAAAENGFTIYINDPGFILWQGPERPPKGAKLTPFGATERGYEQVAIFTADTNKARGFAITAPANASMWTINQVARLQAKYE